MRKLTIVFFDAGGGHRNAAEALKGTLEQQPRPWHVELMNLQDQLDSIDVIRRATGIRIQDGYNLILRKGWTRAINSEPSGCMNRKEISAAVIPSRQAARQSAPTSRLMRRLAATAKRIRGMPSPRSSQADQRVGNR